jgi:outer membrane protein
MSSEFGVALQSGVDIALGHGYGLSFDAKKYFVSTNAHFYARNRSAEHPQSARPLGSERRGQLSV